jgi:hypothetical protein
MLARMMGREGTFKNFWWEYKPVQSLWKTIWKLLKKLNIDLPYDTAIPLLQLFTISK